MFPDRLRALIRSVAGASQDAPEEESLRPQRQDELVAHKQDPAKAQPTFNRPSPAFQQFVRAFPSTGELRLLDLGGANSTNLQFMSQLGTRLYSEDFLATLEDCFGDGDFYENQRDPERIESFLIQTFSEQRGPFDGALVWDTLQFLRPSLLEKTVDHLYRLLEPGAYLLAYFYNDPKAEVVPQYSFRIQDENTLHLTVRGELPPGQAFSNRAIERAFEDFQSVKFFLSRDQILEVLVRR